MAHSAVTFPLYYPHSAHALPPEGCDYWFTLDELGQFTHYRQPRDKWHGRFTRAWPHRIQDGDLRFSAYCVWLVLHDRGQDFLMPADFCAYFQAQHASLVGGCAASAPAAAGIAA